MRTVEHKGATVRVLNKLIEICLEGELGYQTAADHAQDSRLAGVFRDYSRRRAQYAQELRGHVERLGGAPIRSGSVAASLHRGWIALKSAMSGSDPKAIIAACEAGEHAASATYKAALNSDLDSEIRPVIEAQWFAIDQVYMWLRDAPLDSAPGIELPKPEAES